MTTSHTSFLNRPEGRIAFDVTGEGPLVLLVPGMGDLRATYRFLAPALVAAGYRVVTTDLRGHGESDATFTAYGDEATADDIVALVEELGGPAAIVGNSMAAGSAVIAAARRPDLVSGLVLVGPFVRDGAVNAVMKAAMRVAMVPLWAAASWKAYLPKFYAGTKPADFDDYAAEVVASLKRPGYAKSFSLTTRTTHAAAEATLTQVGSRVLVVMGELDPDFKDPEAEARWIADQLGGQVVMVPEAGHYPQSQRPEVVAGAVTGFLAEVAPRA